MKILMLSRLYFPHVGGVEKQVAELSRRLIKKDFEITILTEKFDDSLADKEIIDGVFVIE